MSLSNLVIDSDFTISLLPEVCNTDSPTFSACKTLCKFSVFFLKASDYSEMTGTMTTTDLPNLTNMSYFSIINVAISTIAAKLFLAQIAK